MEILKNVRGRKGPGKPTLRKIVAYSGLTVLVWALVCLFFPGLLINPYLESRIMREFNKTYPGYPVRIAGLRYSVWENRVDCDSASVFSPDSAQVFGMGRVSVKGVGRMSLLLGGGLDPAGFADASLDAKDVVLHIMGSHHELRFLEVRVSVPDSSLVIDSLEYRPPAGDKKFFAESGFRRTRYRLSIPRSGVTGLDAAGMIGGQGYRARAASVDGPTLSVLVDKDRPVNDGAPVPRLPDEILSSIGSPFRIDSLRVTNGSLVYEEKYDAATPPASLWCDSIQVEAAGMGNAAGGGDSAVVRARGILMGTGDAIVGMSLQLASAGLSFRYFGHLGRMDLDDFNPFVKYSEHLRFDTGILHGTDFDITVTDGRASGVVRVVYEDLKIVEIDNLTGSGGGVGNRLVSFLANNIKLRTTNIPDETGSMKIGEVRCDRKSDETFLEFAWLALRSGISDIVGF
jgi:hypothetical protein